MANKPYTNALAAVQLGDARVAHLNASIFQKKDDAANGDPVVKATTNGKKYIVARGTYNHKAASYAFGENNLPAPDGDGNVVLYLYCMIDDAQEELLKSARAVAGEFIEIFGNATAGKAQEGRTPTLWVLNAQVVRLKAKKDDGGAVKIEKNIASVSGKGYGDVVQTMSFLRGTVKDGYNGAAAVTEGVTANGKEYSRFTVEAMLDQHEHAVAFGAADGNGGASKKYVRCSTWGFANDRAKALGLKAGDTVVVLGTTSQYVNERNTTTTDQMNVSRIVSRFAAPAAETAKPAAPAPVAAAPVIAPVSVEDFDTFDDFGDLPF